MREEPLGQRVRVGALRSLSHGTLGMSESALRALVGAAKISPDGLVLDVQVQTLLWLMGRAKVPLMHQMSPEEGRAEMDRTAPILGPRESAPISRLDRVIDTPVGSIPVRVFRPAEGDHPRGVLVFFHGGGWVVGSIDSHDGPCAAIASRSDCAVVSVGYRLAPEHRFPAAYDDALAAFRAVAASLASYGGDTRIAVAGDSAGGNLAAAVALATRTDAVAPRLQVLIYPVTDLSRNHPSHQHFKQGFMLEEAGLDYFVQQYFNTPQEKVDPRASVICAEDVSGAASAFVLTAGFDVLRDEGRAYADKLRAAGVATQYKCYEGMIHGFLSLAGGIRAADESITDITAALRAAFA